MSNLGAMKVQLLNVRIAGIPTFIPNADPKKHHLLCTVICNRGKNSNTQQEMTDEITLNFWGKYAETAALYLDKGREINVDGELRSYRHQTGRVRPSDNRPEIERRVEVLVNRFYFGKDSMKEMSARVNAKIAEIKASGRVLNGGLTAEELLAVTRPQAMDYNHNLATQTGKFGNARVWIKGQGFLAGGTMPAGQPAGQPEGAVLNPEQIQAQIASLTQTLNSLTNSGAVAAGAGSEVNPFPVG